MPSFLTLQLFAPLVSWGELAVGEERQSLPHPTKSAILGIVAAALGYDREDDARHEDLHRRFRLGLNIDQPGVLLVDWHTVQMASPPELRKLRKRAVVVTRADLLQHPSLLPPPITSRRQYYMESLAIAVLEETVPGDPEIDQIAACLDRPHYAPYLGRRSCSPAIPFAPRVIEAASLWEAIDSFEGDEIYRGISTALRGNEKRHRRTLLWEGDDAGAAEASMVRRDALLSRSRWQFTERRFHRQDQEVRDVFE